MDELDVLDALLATTLKVPTELAKQFSTVRKENDSLRAQFRALAEGTPRADLVTELTRLARSGRALPSDLHELRNAFAASED